MISLGQIAKIYPWLKKLETRVLSKKNQLAPWIDLSIKRELIYIRRILAWIIIIDSEISKKTYIIKFNQSLL